MPYWLSWYSAPGHCSAVPLPSYSITPIVKLSPDAFVCVGFPPTRHYYYYYYYYYCLQTGTIELFNCNKAAVATTFARKDACASTGAESLASDVLASLIVCLITKSSLSSLLLDCSGCNTGRVFTVVLSPFPARDTSPAPQLTIVIVIINSGMTFCSRWYAIVYQKV